MNWKLLNFVHEFANLMVHSLFLSIFTLFSFVSTSYKEMLSLFRTKLLL